MSTRISCQWVDTYVGDGGGGKTQTAKYKVVTPDIAPRKSRKTPIGNVVVLKYISDY